MRNNKRNLLQSICLAFLTLLLLAASTLAWFSNLTSVAFGKLAFSAPSLKTEIVVEELVYADGEFTVTDENIIYIDSNILFTAYNMAPGEIRYYRVSVINHGNTCMAYFGLDRILNKDAHGDPLSEDDKPLSGVLRLSVYPADEIGQQPHDGEIIGERSYLFGVNSATIPASSSVQYVYELTFVGNTENESPLEQNSNEYMENMMEAVISVSVNLT